MSDAITLLVEPRETLGKGVKRLRKSGIVPAVIHDHGKASIHIQANHQAITKVFHTAGRHHPVELKVGDKKYTALIRSASIDPRLGTVTHVVFNAVSANQTVEAQIPVKPRYAEGNESSPAERAGLIVLTQLDEVEVKALPKNLPNELFYDAEKLVAVGDHVNVSDLDVPEGVVVETDAAHAVAAVFEPSALAAANDEAGGDAEEVAPAAEEAEGEDAAAETAPADSSKE
ncbi:50S ribosomal protein L25 [Candidatus Saccharibacteria bacterium]|nr:MAG: 50S ribosomal protein L25 [Candidatus Saccharibacteria bacterium]